MCSIAEMSMPRGSRAAPRLDRRRAQLADERDRAFFGRHRHERAAQAGRQRRVLNVASTITPSVPSDPMKRSIRSMSGAM